MWESVDRACDYSYLLGVKKFTNLLGLICFGPPLLGCLVGIPFGEAPPGEALFRETFREALLRDPLEFEFDSLLSNTVGNIRFFILAKRVLRWVARKSLLRFIYESTKSLGIFIGGMLSIRKPYKKDTSILAPLISLKGDVGIS